MIRRSVIAAETAVRKLAWEGERLRWRLFHPLTLGARVILLRGDEVLLIRHTYRQGWFFPGGGVEKGETLAAAARREAGEEARAAVRELTLLGVYASVDSTKSDYVAVFVSREFDLMAFEPGNEIAAREWFPINALPEGMSTGSARRVREAAAGGPPHAGGW